MAFKPRALPRRPLTRVAFRLAYDGTAFSGSQRQSDVRTVEGDLLAALAHLGVAPDGFALASRTDAGVSARANVLALDTTFPPEELARAVTATTRDLWLWAWAPASDGFRPRHARERVYRYHLPERGLDAKRLGAALRSFEGRHDFTSFARLEGDAAPVRDLTEARAVEEGDWLVLSFRAPSFLWNQVRRIVAAATAHARDEVALDVISEALSGRRVVDLGVAEPEPLVLHDVIHDLAWRPIEALAGKVGDAFRRERARRALGTRILADLARGTPLDR